MTRHDEHREGIETESLETENNPVAFAELTSSNGWDEYQIDNFSVMAIAESFEIKNKNLLSENDLNGHVVKLKTKTEQLFAIAESGNPMSFLNEKPHDAFNKTIDQHYSSVSHQTTQQEIWPVIMAKQ